MDTIKNISINRFFPILTTGIMIAAIDIFFEISLSTLMFSGELSDYIPAGIGMLLFGAMVMNIIVSLTSSVPGIIAVPQDSTVAILAICIGTLSQSMSLESSEFIFMTSLGMITLSTLLVGIFFILVGYLKISQPIRYVPYPVIGGFLAGTGWLIVEGGLSVLTDLKDIFQYIKVPNNLFIILFAFSLSILLLYLSRRSRNPIITALVILLSIGIFYLWLSLSDIPFTEANTRGYLLGGSSQGYVWTPAYITKVFEADWSIILENSAQIISILAVSIFSMLFITSGIETTIHKDIDFDRELQSAGIANLVAAVGGSPSGYHALSFSTLTYQMRAPYRMVGIVTATSIGIILFFGLSLIEYVPLAVASGILIFLGLSFLIDWLYEGRKFLPLIDYILMIIIVVIIVAFGFLEGIFAGIGVAIILFVYNYSKLDIVKHKLSGDTYRSKINRSRVQRDYLREHGIQILILDLQGYLFFGTSFNLLKTVKSRLLDRDLAPLRYLVLDFRLVDGIDTSTIFIFKKILLYGKEEAFDLIISNTSQQIRNQLNKSGLSEQAEGLIFVPSLDHGVEYCENQLLSTSGLLDQGYSLDLRIQLKDIFQSDEVTDKFFNYLEYIEINTGQHLITQGDSSDHIYFIESGMLSVQLQLKDRSESRVTTMQAGTIVGEIGFYLGINRTASVIANQPSRLYRLSNKSYKRMENQDPMLAAALHQWVVKILAERLSDNIKTLEELLY